MAGKFISFEGIDGAGKSTHVPWCLDYLRERNVSVVSVREPGGTPLGESLREVLLTQKMSSLSETLLMFASRQQLVADVIAPALARGDWVVTDRFVDASFAYQGGGRGVSTEQIQWLTTLCVGTTMPECTFWFSAPLEVAQKRRSQGRSMINGVEDRFEQENALFFQRVHQAYHQRWEEDPDRIVKLDSTQSIEQLRLIIADKLESLVGQ